MGRDVGGMGGGRCDESLLVGQCGGDVTALEGRLLPNGGPVISSKRSFIFVHNDVTDFSTSTNRATINLI